MSYPHIQIRCGIKVKYMVAKFLFCDHPTCGASLINVDDIKNYVINKRLLRCIACTTLTCASHILNKQNNIMNNKLCLKCNELQFI